MDIAESRESQSDSKARYSARELRVAATWYHPRVPLARFGVALANPRRVRGSKWNIDRVAIESRSSRDRVAIIQLARSVAHRPLHIAVSQMHRHFLTARPERGALRGVERSGSRNVNRTSSILLHPRLTGPWDVS